MQDHVFINFLERQLADGMSLAASSDILKLRPLSNGLGPPQRYLAQFHCRGLIQEPGDRIGEANLFEVGIFFPNDYLRRAATPEVLTWLSPVAAFHPNILGPAGAICIGRMEPATNLVSILYQVFELIVFRSFNSQENNALNRTACAWARNNKHCFPTDPRSLRRPRYSTPRATTTRGGAS